MAFHIILIISLFLVGGAVILYNRLVRLRNKADEAFSIMDVYLVKRHDLVPALADTVRAYAAHEADILRDVADKRAQNRAQHLDNETRLSVGIAHTIAVAEAYPDLKSSQNFIDLQKSLSSIEDEIASARRYYNGSVRLFNDACMRFPSNLVAKCCNFKTLPMFQSSPNA